MLRALQFDEYVNGDDSGDNDGWDLAEFMDDPLFKAVRNNDGVGG